MPLRAERPRVLIVDDDAGLRRTLEDVLGLEGYESMSAGTAGEALGLFATGKFPLTIVDLRLPDADGLELAGRFMALKPVTQVVIVTGNASVESAIRAVRDHGCDYLVKPVRPAELLRTMSAAEDRWRLKVTEKDLERSESMTRALFEASPLPMVVFDAGLHVRLWNPAAEAVFGWTAREVEGRPPPMVGEGTARKDVLSALDGVRTGDRRRAIEVQHFARDGRPLDMRLYAAPVGASGADAGAVLAVYEDVTEQRRIEESLQHVQRLDAVGRLAGGIAHDFNNLLAILCAELDLVLSDSALPAHLVVPVASARSTADRGANLTRQLLTFARRQPMQSEIVPANTVVSDLERMLERLLAEPIRLRVVLGAEEGHVNVDRGKLEQVVTNLVVNARDAIGGAGRITISTSIREAPPASAVDLEAGEWVVIAVQDTGGGIPEALRSRIFEPFFTTKAPGYGTGLGLATSFGIIQGMGGVITVDSQVGKGTTFYVSLPRAHGSVTAAEEDGRVDVPTGSETILVVEDNATLRDVTRRILVRQGYTVHSAEDGLEARRVLDNLERLPDLLFVDAHLPTGDGRDLIAALRKEHPSLKALLTSGSFEVARRADVDTAFIEKPYTLASVASAVRAVLDGEELDADEVHA